MQIIINKTIQVLDSPEFIAKFVAPELTFVNPKYSEAVKAGRSTWGIAPEIKNISVDSNSVIHIPRGYKDRLLEIAAQEKETVILTDQRATFSATPPFAHSMELRKYQYDALQAVAQHSEGLLIGPAGSGKTIMGIALIVMSGQKALWITHTKYLADQFISRLNSFVKDLSNGDIGFISEGSWNVGDRVTVGLVQTLIRSEDKLREVSNDFGIIIVDEAHHVPASTFTTVVNNLNSYYLYGLTATPYRRDGLQNIMVQNLGPIRYEIDRKIVSQGKNVITPVVKVIKLQTHLPLTKSYPDIVKALVLSKYRNDIIVQDIAEEASKGNICIAVTERVSHAESLYNSLKALNIKVGLAVGKLNNKERRLVLDDLEKGKITVLVCTSHLLGEGFDFPPLNRLFMCLPIRNQTRVEQLVGRVQRPSPNKIDAIIYDYVDETSGICKNQYKSFNINGSRHSVYVKLGCKILE